MCERAPNRAHAHYVNFARLRTPGGGDGSGFSVKRAAALAADRDRLLQTLVFLDLRRRGMDIACLRSEQGYKVDFLARPGHGETLAAPHEEHFWNVFENYDEKVIRAKYSNRQAYRTNDRSSVAMGRYRQSGLSTQAINPSFT